MSPSRTGLILAVSLAALALLAAAGYGAWRWRRTVPAAPVSRPAASVEVFPPTPLDFTPVLQEDPVNSTAAGNTQAVLQAYKLKLRPEQVAFLDRHRFLLVPVAETSLAGTANLDEMLAAFDAIGGSPMIEYRRPENAKLITPDLVLHAFHVYFGMTLEELEKAELRQTLDEWLGGMLQAAAQARRKAPEPRALDRIVAQLAVAKVLLENRGPAAPGSFEKAEDEEAWLAADAKADTAPRAMALVEPRLAGLSREVSEQARAELKLVYGAEGLLASPLYGLYDPSAVADYTQFTPRSHYGKSSALRAYFRAMMFLGRNAYPLKSDEGLRDAMLLAGLMGPSGPLWNGWNRIMAVTTLYAGVSDDLTFAEWNPFLAHQAGADPARVRQNLGGLRLPRILSEVTTDRATAAQGLDERLQGTLSFRLFGQRFSYDAWILGRLTKEAKCPPTALYVPAAFGDARAREHARAFAEAQAQAGERALQGLDAAAQALAKVPPAAWQASMDAAWLELLATLTQGYGPGYPGYMQSDTFRDKQLQTYLGSYAELKHDTLLYAKQNYAEMGEGGDEKIPPVVKGFVEPNLVFWNKLSALLELTRAFYEKHGLFKQGLALERLREFSSHVGFFRTLAWKELKSRTITDDEYEKLRNLSLGFMAEPLSGQVAITEDTGRTALVADIHTDAERGRVLYEATGRPYVMLALVGNEKSPRLTVGVAFSHFEFSEGLEKRLTDEAWRERVHATPPRLPARNPWYQGLAAR